MVFPILYKKTKIHVKSWYISVIANSETSKKVTIKVLTGFVGMKMTEFNIEITEGKNIGRSNETTSFEQALSEAQSKWNKKKDVGYTENEDGEDTSSLIRPMLAQSFPESENKLNFPDVSCQPKLDGIRAIYQNGQFHSRKLKVFPHLEHIIEELKGVNLILDGELYSDHLDVQVISGIVRKKKFNTKDFETIKKIQFRVYDLVNKDPFIDRFEILKTFFSKNNFKHVKIVKTVQCKDSEQAKVKHDSFVQEGYEGLILRNNVGLYQQDTRSYSFQKFKSFDDSEFEVTGFKDGVGKEKGAVIWIFKTKKGGVFDARPIGSITERKKIYKIAKDFIGTFITVKHFGLTDDNLPRFPVSDLLPRIDI